MKIRIWLFKDYKKSSPSNQASGLPRRKAQIKMLQRKSSKHKVCWAAFSQWYFLSVLDKWFIYQSLEHTCKCAAVRARRYSDRFGCLNVDKRIQNLRYLNYSCHNFYIGYCSHIHDHKYKLVLPENTWTEDVLISWQVKEKPLYLFSMFSLQYLLPWHC